MSFPFPIIEDDRVPANEVWYYSRNPQEVITPDGQRELRTPDAKIVNIGREPSKLDWVPAPH